MKTVTLGEIAKISSGGTPSRSEKSYWSGNIPWVTTSLIQNGIITEDDIEEWITDEGMKNSSAKMVPAGTILMAMYGQGKTRGQVAVLNVDATINQACAAITVNDGINKDFVYQQLLYRYDDIRKLSNNGSQENLNAGLIRYIRFPLGSLTEQTKIANTLTTYDNAIKMMERLIAAKKRYFDGLLTQLIRNKNGQELKKISDLKHTDLRIEKGKALTKEGLGHNGTIPVVAGGQNYAYYHDKATHSKATITISASGAYAGYVWFHDYPIWASDCNVFYCNDEVSTEYLYYALKAQQNKIFALQSGGAQPHIYPKDLKNILIPVVDALEQSRVVQILSTATHEMNLLKKLAESYRLQKRGLMQKLLRGEWRVAA